MKISIIKKEDKLKETTSEESVIINKRNYSAIILFTKVIVAIIYAFGLGYSLFFLGDDFIKEGLVFLALLIISYIIIEIPYALIKSLFLPKVFEKDNIRLLINPFTMAIDICSNIKISRIRYIFSILIPFIIFAIVPTIASYILEFHMYLYVIASASAIIATKDIMYLIILLINHSKGNSFKIELNEFIFKDN
ncbi:MAG: DUF3267 domain-containing protein [Clostridium sartagoforme]|nr:DUF3267 domain-containing protein [Clostridium sartagoforme]